MLTRSFSMGILRTLAALALACCTLASIAAGCGEPDPVLPGDAGIDAYSPPPTRRDSGPPFDASRIPPHDAGPFEIDGGACESWGLTDELEPITGVTPGEWTFVPFPDAHCMNGESTGIGINLSPTGGDRLVIYLEGGGACFDETTCAGVLGQAGFTAETLAAVRPVTAAYGVFRREDPYNPMRDWHQVYVPYCTGDAHSGTNPSGYEGRMQVGFSNVHEYLRRLVPTFRDVEMVVLTGASAGGLGSMSNYDQVAQAFGCTPVHMLDDSGPILDDDAMRPCLQARVRELWGVTPPADCPQCTQPDGGGLVALWRYLVAKYPDRRFGMMSYTRDSTIRGFYGAGFTSACLSGDRMNGDAFREALFDLRDRVLADTPNAALFLVEGDAHTFTIGGYRTPVAGDVVLSDWIADLIDGDPGWRSVGP